MVIESVRLEFGRRKALQSGPYRRIDPYPRTIIEHTQTEVLPIGMCHGLPVLATKRLKGYEPEIWQFSGTLARSEPFTDAQVGYCHLPVPRASLKCGFPRTGSCLVTLASNRKLDVVQWLHRYMPQEVFDGDVPISVEIRGAGVAG